MKDLWLHVRHNYREGGIRQVCRKVVSRLQHWLWSEASWLIYKIDVADYCFKTAMPLDRRQLGFDSLRELNYFKAAAFPEIIRTRLDAGARCNAFFVDTKLVNIAWTTMGYLEVEPGVCIAEAGCVGIYDCYTLPEHRSKGIYTGTLIQLVGEIALEGATRALIAVDPGNRASIKGIERAGFQPLYQLTRLCRFGRHSLQRSDFRKQD
jgi:hypothetical protein